MRALSRSLVIALISLVCSSPALAQTATGFALDRLVPSERGQDWFAADSLDVRGQARVTGGIVAGWSHEPLVVYDGDSGERERAIVANQWFGHVYASFTIVERLRLNVNLPVLIHQDGDSATLNGEQVRFRNATTLGDLRVGALLRLLGKYREPFSLGFGVQVFLPTGERSSFTGNGTVKVVPRLVAAGEISQFVYSAQAGLGLSPRREGWVNPSPGQSLGFVLAAGVRPIERLVIGPELWGETILSDSRFLKRTSTPLELLLGAHYAAGEFNLGAGAGAGLTRGYGAPQVRVVLGVEYAPAVDEPAPVAAALPTDQDGDGIIDKFDACPTEPGVETSDPATNGCPPPKDRDGDGVVDATDACPDEVGVRQDDPKKNGCPLPKDTDADGIPDETDACPEVAGEPAEDPKQHGCPRPKDRDGDGILDPDDACPDAPGPANAQPQSNGCPLARVESTQIVILEAVRFAYNSDRILPESEGVLNAVIAVLAAHPEIEGLEVHGHTDDKGAAAYNLRLSERRAASVAKWLVAHGIQKDRIRSSGFGKTRPIVPNDSEQNRERNRRVEFHIVPKSQGQ